MNWTLLLNPLATANAPAYRLRIVDANELLSPLYAVNWATLNGSLQAADVKTP